MEFTCAFLNCKLLYSADSPTRFRPADATAVGPRIEDLAGTLRDAVQGLAPDVIGLCEVGDAAAGLQLAEAIEPNFYGQVWSGEQPLGASGLMILFNRNLFAASPEYLIGALGRSNSRLKGMAALLTVRASPDHLLWMTVVHWSSPETRLAMEHSHNHSWIKLSDFLHERNCDTEAMIIGGDFNCEPGDSIFDHQAEGVYEATRERSLLLSPRRTKPYLYNLMWRKMGEPHAHGDRAAEHGPEYPLGTIRIDGVHRMLDQILVSRRLLTGEFFQLLERTVRVSEPRNGCSAHSAIGVSIRMGELR